MSPLSTLGALIATGAALAFAIIGLLTLYSGLQATREQILPGFRPDRPSLVQRALTIAAVLLPVGVLTVFGLYACIHILRVALGVR